MGALVGCPSAMSVVVQSGKVRVGRRRGKKKRNKMRWKVRWKVREGR
jgi:hypothetical protein